MKVGIVDYGMGNLTSVRNAFQSLGSETEILDKPSRLPEVSHIVLPGVGAFGDAMKNLRKRGWDKALSAEVREGKKPFLGICLGMQLLADVGTENGEHEGLGWVRGRVVRFPEQEGIRIPHVGWNDVAAVHARGCYPSAADAGVFYFVHSYHLVPEDGSLVDGWCEHGTRFAASLSSENLRAVQFHPEKSQRAGLRVLKHFTGEGGPC